MEGWDTNPILFFCSINRTNTPKHKCLKKIFIARGEASNPFLGGTDPYFRSTIDWNHIDKDHQFVEGVKRIKEGMMEDPILWLKWMIGWYMNMLTHLLHMVFIPVDRYTYGMLPFLMLASTHLITQAIYVVRNALTTSLLQRRGI
jgi:hypothetical protein